MSGMTSTGATPPCVAAQRVGGGLGLAGFDPVRGVAGGAVQQHDHRQRGLPGHRPGRREVNLRRLCHEARDGARDGEGHHRAVPGARALPGADPGERRLVRRGLPERLAERAEVPEVGVDADGCAGEYGDGQQQREQDPRSATDPHPCGAERDEHADGEQYRSDRPPRVQREAREVLDHIRPGQVGGMIDGRSRPAWRGGRRDAAHRLRHEQLAQTWDREEALGAGVEQSHPR